MSTAGSRRIARLSRARMLGRHTRAQWEALLVWCGEWCPRCTRHTPYHRLQKDHVVPLHMGGCDCIFNLQPLCERCNAGKGSETINWITARMPEYLAGVNRDWAEYHGVEAPPVTPEDVTEALNWRDASLRRVA